MKTILSSILILLAFTASFGQKKVVEDSIYVYGNCEMCKETMEAGLDKPGIKMVDWNMDTKQMFIAYKPDKISLDEIHQAVAATGYDTKKVKAKDEVYAKLDFCCLYRDHNPRLEHDEDPHKKDNHND